MNLFVKILTSLLLFVPLLEMISGCSPKTEEGADPGVQPSIDSALLGPLHGRWTGDLDKILESRRVIRVLVSYGKTNFTIVNGQPQGLEYELLHEYEHFLHGKVGKRGSNPIVIFITVPSDQRIPLLLDGGGDIAAGEAITPQREKLVAFTEPYIMNVNEVIVTGKAVAGLRTLDDLSGRTVHVVSGSSYAEHLKDLNKRLGKTGRRPVRIVEVDRTLEEEDILEMVNSGIFRITVVDNHIADLWCCVLQNIAVRKDIILRGGGNLACAVRKENPKLLASLNEFIGTKARQGTVLGNMLFARYYGATKWMLNPIAESEKRKLMKLRFYFRKYAKMYDFDWLTIAAMAYQESGLNQNRRSRRGAVGIMQVIPATAARFGLRNVATPENNIQAGVKYLAYLRQTYFNDPGMSPGDKVDFALAAYDAGPAKIASLRQKAGELGMDPNKWFFSVERLALKEMGRETVQYVANVNKYFIAYKSVERVLEVKRIKEERKNKQEESLEESGPP
ncbi:MAG TPA: transporter substrate-binding domain-containing protein [Thermodesulfovibrionales bacterium]|nr:transporter substrate-binding domain-containing protein [Thermodesulfovibrionales bacterium]